MSMNWKPEIWATLAHEQPGLFLKELAVQRKPSASLFTKTYIQCAVQGFRGLNKHQNTQYEEAFFLNMANLLPHEDAQRPEKFELGSIQHLNTNRTPIEYLLWRDALNKRLNPAEKFNYHGWLLELRKPSYDPEKLHDRFSLVHAPSWAVAYTEIQRGGSTKNLLEWLLMAPIAQALGVVNAAGSLHAEGKPLWLARSLETVLSNPAKVYDSGSIYDILSAMSNAWKVPTPQLDAAIAALVCEQPKGLSMMEHAWFGGHYGRERHAPMLDWWSRQPSQQRGLILHHWLVEGTTWDALSKEETNAQKPGTALDMFTRCPVDIPSDLARDIVQIAPFDKEPVRTYLARFIPAIHAAELTVEPQSFKSYLLQSWDALHEKAPALSVDGLLDFQP